jgi:hypothetical protein
MKLSMCREYEELLRESCSALEAWSSGEIEAHPIGQLENRAIRLFPADLIKGVYLLIAHRHECEICRSIPEIDSFHNGHDSRLARLLGSRADRPTSFVC